MSDVGALVALNETMASAGEAAPWGDMQKMAKAFGAFMTFMQGTRAAVNFVNKGAVAVPPEPVNVPAPLFAVPEPEVVPAPEIVPVVVAVATVSVLADEEAKHEAPASTGATAELDEPFVPEPYASECEHELEVEPLRMPEEAEPLPLRKRFREQVWDGVADEEKMPARPSGQMIDGNRKRKAPGNFDTFERKTMDFASVSEHFAPTKTFNLPPAISMTRLQCEEKIRALQMQYRLNLSMQSIRAMRNTAASGPSRIKMLRLEIAELEREVAISSEIEELLDYCDTLRKLCGCRTVKSGLAIEARLLGQE